MAKAKKDEKGDDALVDVLTKMTETLGRIEEKLNKPIGTISVPVQAVASPTPLLSGVPVPLEFVEVINTTLNRKFGVEVNYMADTASFEFSILVPQQYSNAAKSHWDTYHEDRRSKVIENALGVNGVREWATTVYNNFNVETRSAITAGRAEL